VITLALSGSDPDGDTLTWSAVGLPTGLSIDPGSGLVSGTITYDASPGSPYAVTVTLADGGTPTRFSTMPFTWSVADTNRAPTISDPGSQVDGEGDTVTLALSGSDPDGDGLTWSATGLPPGLSIDPATGSITGTVGFSAAGGSPYAVTVTLADGGMPSLQEDATFTWTVADTNRSPTITGLGNQTSAEGDVISLAPSASDPDGDGLTWSATGLPSGLSIDSSTGRISGTVSYAVAGVYTVTVGVTDDGSPALGDQIVFTWTVEGTNRAPTLTAPGSQTSAEGDSVSLAMMANDPDGDGLTWSATGTPGGLSIDPDSGRISGTVSYTAAGIHNVTVTVTDDGDPSLSDQATFTWMVNDTNRAPAVSDPGDRVSNVGDSAGLTLSASDPDGDAISWSVTGLPPGLVASGATISGTPTAAGTYTVAVTVTDDGEPQLSGSTSFIWRIEQPDAGGPVIDPIENRYDEIGDTIRFTATGTDPDGGPLTWSASGLPTGIGIDPVTGLVSGTVTRAGVFTVTITATDPTGNAARAGFLWTVTDPVPPPEAVDEPPYAENDDVEIGDGDLGGGTLTIDVLGNDVDPEAEPLVIVGTFGVEVGTVTIVDGRLAFTPPPGWSGTTSFTYQIADPAGNTATALVSITITENTVIGGAALTWTPPEEMGRSVDSLSLDPSLAGDLVLGTVFQSLYVLRMPLALLGGAVLWSLMLGGAFSVGVGLRHGLPFLRRRPIRLSAVVLERHGGRVPAHVEPGEGEVIWRFNATDRGIPTTGKSETVDDVEWIEVDTPEGRGWVEAARLTEQIDAAGFADDRRPLEGLEGLIDTFREGGDPSEHVSERGLWVVHHDSPVHYTPEQVGRLLSDGEMRTWRGRNPAYPDVEGTFTGVVATSVLSAWDHPQRDLAVDQPAVPSTVVPIEFSNFHAISIGADLQGRERLDQTAWMAFFDYHEGHPSIVALLKEG
jgi:hypothetical protein